MKGCPCGTIQQVGDCARLEIKKMQAEPGDTGPTCCWEPNQELGKECKRKRALGRTLGRTDERESAEEAEK